MPKLIIVTVGTSALEKWHESLAANDNDKRLSLEELIDELNYGDDDRELYDCVKGRVYKALSSNMERYLNGDDEDSSRLSAEIASLWAIHEDEGVGPISSEDRIVLLHSDTADGELCGEVSKDLIQPSIALDGTQFKNAWNVDVPVRVEGLNASDPETFACLGLKNLQNIVANVLDNFVGQKYINITGGYKGLIPFATMLVYSKQITLLYLFEKSEGLVILDRDYFVRRFGLPTGVEGEQAGELSGNIIGRRRRVTPGRRTIKNS